MGAVGLAVIVALATARSSSLLRFGTAAVTAQLDGLQLRFLLAVGVALTASIIAAVTMHRQNTRPAPAPGASLGPLEVAETR